MKFWQPIKGTNGIYLVNKKGVIKSVNHYLVDKRGIKQFFKGKILKTDSSGEYARVSLCVNGNVRRLSVHRIVAIVFKKNPLKKKYVNHKNGKKRDNRASNLEWCTHSENVKHSFKIGLQSNVGVKAPACKLTEKQVMRIFYSVGSSTQISKKYPITARTVRDIKEGRSWTHLTKKVKIRR